MTQSGAVAVVAAKTPRWFRWSALAVVVTCAVLGSSLLVTETEVSTPAPAREPKRLFVIGAIRSSDAVRFENLQWIVKEELLARVPSILADGRPQLRIEGTGLAVDALTDGPAGLRCTVRFLVTREGSGAIRAALSGSARVHGPDATRSLAEDACRSATRAAMHGLPRLAERR